VDKRFQYRQRHVVDIPVGESFVRVWTADREVDRKGIAQAFAPLFRESFVYPYVALMPDFHPGLGVMIGSVVPSRNVFFPTIIGGDIGCGMTAVQLPVEASRLHLELARIREGILAAIPTGTDHNNQVTDRVKNSQLWRRETRAPILGSRVLRKLIRQFASLGGGNHFIELQADEEDQAWVMLHSGSRYVGVLVRDYYVEKGKELDGIKLKKYASVPYLPIESRIAGDYLLDLSFSVEFARESRKEMCLRTLEVLNRIAPQVEASLVDSAIDIAHNTISAERLWGETLYVHRKGATAAREGMIGLIPGSMGSNSYVVEGRGNEFGFASCSHGAGRRLSRNDALQFISDQEFQKSMEGINYQHDDRVRDEAPSAYKDIKRVMRAQKDLVKILHQLSPIMSIKGV
jgi:tRNA-splicing ligase RtcB (3'-phosphate/5'-hydroxy nucleic acid ligase)